MKISELPIEVQEQLAADRMVLANKVSSDGYSVMLYNTDGTRYFSARRYQRAWSNDRGAYMHFGGGSYWKVTYGSVQFARRKNPVGEWEYELVNGKQYGKSSNGTVIPTQVETKKEVMAIAKAIGIFNI